MGFTLKIPIILWNALLNAFPLKPNKIVFQRITQLEPMCTYFTFAIQYHIEIVLLLLLLLLIIKCHFWG